jgi:hypothetical protein
MKESIDTTTITINNNNKNTVAVVSYDTHSTTHCADLLNQCCHGCLKQLQPLLYCPLYCPL